MLKANYFCTFFFAFCFGFAKADSVKEFPVADYEFINNNTQPESNATGNEDHIDNDEEDVYDDYIRIHIFQAAEFRSALRSEDKLWDNGVVPYEISDKYKSEDKKFILNAMEEFHNKTCVHFKRRKDEKSYISIVPGSGCSAVLGNATTMNKVTLGENCLVKGIVLHELMHSLGFTHEQNRPDRDEFVNVSFDNIKEGSERNFDKLSSDKVQTFNQSYDYGSVMHYGAFDFAKNRSMPTIIALQKDKEIGQRKGFSEIDLIKINLLYNCDNNTRNSDYITDEVTDDKTQEKDGNEERSTEIQKSRLFLYFSKLFG